ncbi:MAG TPA: GAF domain-containing sensor histidine kinase [Acidimicrobiales bacterium]|nr:GAF domain-containing sensor histidine kinase [Acidimicrobiales bacterium]
MEYWPARLRTLLDAALQLTGPHDLDEVLQRIVDGAAEVLGARYAALATYDEGGRIRRFVHHGLDAAAVALIGRLPEGRGLLGHLLAADGPLRVDDLAAEERACGFPAGHPPMRTLLGVPVMRGGRRYGNLYLSEKGDGRPFDAEDEALAATLAAFATGAVESAELVAAERARVEAVTQQVAAEERARSRQALLAEVIAAQEAERARVARDLHDDVGQALTSVLLGLRLVEDAGPYIEELRELVADALRRTRELAFELRPTVLDDIGLTAALERLTQAVGARAALPVGLAVTGLDAGERLDPAVETVVYRVAQEALTNVVRHAAASEASVTVAVGPARVRVLVEDDGAGFEPRHPPPGGHLGIEGMHERVALVGGTLQILSEPGRGTTVVAELPRAPAPSR